MFTLDLKFETDYENRMLWVALTSRQTHFCLTFYAPASSLSDCMITSSSQGCHADLHFLANGS